MKYRHQTPSVIAKLMGLDEEHPQHHVRGKKRVLSEKYLQKVASIGVRLKRSFHEYHSFRTSMEEKGEAEDVLKVFQTIRDKHHNLSVVNGKENPDFPKGKTRGVGQEICDAECVSVNTKPETFMASTRSFGFETSEKLGKMNEQRNLQLLQNIDNGLQKELNGEPGLHEIYRFLKPQLELKDETFPSRTVVLKSKPEKGGSDLKYSPLLSSENHHLSYGFLEELCFPERRGRKKLSYHTKSVKHSSRAFTKISQEACSQTGNAAKRVSDTVSSSVFRGNETFGNSSDLLNPGSKVEKLCNSPFFCPDSSEDSFVACEANDKNLEQKDVTEKLSIPAQGLGTGKLAHKLGKHGYQSNSSDTQVNDRKVPNSGPVCVPSVSAGSPRTKTNNGIFHHNRFLRHDASINWVPNKSKRQNFCQKDCSEHINLRPTSKKSLSFLSDLSNNPKEENCISLHEVKAKYGNALSDQKPILPQSTRSDVPSNFKDCDIMRETCLRKDEVKNHKLEDSNMSEQISPPDSSIDYVAADTKTEVVGRSCGNQEEKQTRSAACILLGGDIDSSSHTPCTSVQQGTLEFYEEDSVCSLGSGTCSDSLVSLEEVFEPSPISVLEPPYREDLSSSYEFMETVGSECMKTIGSDIYDPSEMDCGGYDLDVSSDEDPDGGSIVDFERKQDFVGFFRVEESRDFSYVVEVLTEAGFSNRNLHADFSTWHSLECPISPSVFEILEKKFGEQPLWKRSDRKLLFDCINLGMLEILNPCKCNPIWVKPALRRWIAEPSQDMIEEELWALLVSQEKEAKKESADKMLGGEIRWVELSEEIEVIVREIAEFSIDELAKEIVCLESF
ncbi:hypothetical protein L6164_005519 [Bauhinia variegata]|uniref:Uncharacterized protein n=1 Tax=Bauhinia variegata TaxID=167791 RepID=A0ACB9PU63_BAUVA|nr:hypothetical protein L6164_005519 [Bauhinia variegata]